MDCSIGIIISCELVSSTTRVTLNKFEKPLFVSEFETLGPRNWTPGIPFRRIAQEKDFKNFERVVEEKLNEETNWPATK